MKFTGQIRIPEIDHPGVPATFLIESNQAEVVLEGESLGRWSLFDVRARRLVSSAFQVEFENEEITFLADEPIDFAYRGVEHMAEVWAKYKTMNVARRVVAVKRSRQGVKPSKIGELREAMLANVGSHRSASAIAGEHVASGDIAPTGNHTRPPTARRGSPEPGAARVVPPEAPTAGETTGDTQDRLEAERREADLLKERKEEAARLVAERMAIEEDRARLEDERRQLEEQRRAAEQKEADRIEAFRLEMERLERERAAAAETEAERMAALEAERERLEAERAERDKQAAHRVQAAQEEAARLDEQRAEMERLEAERAKRERMAEERAMAAQEAAARLDEQRAEMEGLEAERIAAARAEMEELQLKRAEILRLEAERAEQVRKDQEKLAEVEAEMERLEVERAERLAAEEAEMERLEAEKVERLAAEKAEAVPKASTEMVRELLETGDDSTESSKQLVVDLGELEDGEPPAEADEGEQAPLAPEPVLAGAARDKSGIMGAVRSAFGRSGKNHVHDFVEAPGGIGIARSICRECGYVSISSD